MRGEYDHMLNVAEQAALSDTGLSQLLIAIANAELGRPRDAKVALEKMSHHESLARDPTAFLRRNRVADKLVDALVGGLSKARTLSRG
jgi:hypothetical protein